MTDRTAEISASVRAAGAGVSEALSRAEQRLESARNKYETAAMHGWDGVAGDRSVTFRIDVSGAFLLTATDSASGASVTVSKTG